MSTNEALGQTSPSLDNQEKAKGSTPAFRMAWRESGERKRLQRGVPVIIGTSLAVWLITAIIAFIYERYSFVASCASFSSYEYGNSSANTPQMYEAKRDACNTKAIPEAFDQSAYTIAFAGAIVLVLGFYGYVFYRATLRRELKDRLLLEEVQRNLSVTEDAVYGKDSDTVTLELSPLWNATHNRLNLYHRIATKQAQDSFRRAQAAMVSGFTIVAISATMSLFATSVASALSTGILGAVAAGLSGFIGHTFIRSQETAAQHLRAYFLQPLEFSRYLVAERLLNTLNEQQKAEGILTIVQGIAQFSAIGGDTRIAAEDPPAESAKS